MKRILITGSRDWTDRLSIEKALLAAWLQFRDFGPVTLVHGACPSGADAIAAEIWGAQGFPLDPHPADWDAYGKAAGPLRNQEMVDLGADLCLAFPKGVSRGTRDCIRRAEDAGIPVRVFEAPA